MIVAMMDIMPGEFEALSLVAPAIAGLAIGGVLAFSLLMVSILVRRDSSPGILKGWAIAAPIICDIKIKEPLDKLPGTSDPKGRRRSSTPQMA
ncbi:MAG: hypothetical protein EA001_01915 [Oscillatoriales cyanobacterium]|nr:MAG: hypothetical protein EA001_01915 [Oscillatoriales cyanobacterium]